MGGVFGLGAIAILVWIFIRCRRVRRNSGMGFTATQLPDNELTLPRHNLELKTKSNSSSPNGTLRLPPPSPKIAASLSRPKLAATTTAPIITKHEIVKVIHSYAPAAVDELDLVEGDDLILIKRFDDGWAVGMQPVSGRQGVFPLICVATAEATPKSGEKGGFIDTTRLSKRMSSIASRSSSPLNAGGQGKDKVPVLFGYEALQEDELTLVPGDELIIVKRFDDGWGVGLIPATGMKGAFPLVCVTGGDGGAGKTASIISKRTSSFIF
ncbi:hypothetical protein CcCBS67573_g10397 [Chytriomyces confervae]|uniref:SH3 domain-containing protein n=1 Tax=Chytriomyces confervae TaxID=246404 RepID=A0A507D0C0_9FUNG|nr:hypothetical protein CcCBS67573_g10397 [Chytriomyces confervae]